MKIIRGDQEFELTPDELCSAYFEQQHNYDCEDIISALEEMKDGDNDNIVDAILQNEQKISRMANHFRDRADGNDVILELEWELRDEIASRAVSNEGDNEL